MNGRLLKRYLLLALVASTWISVILFYTKGGLLWGGDYPGYYGALQAIYTGNPVAAMFGLGLLLSLGNIYVGFYLGLFLGVYANLIVLTYFFEAIFPSWKMRTTPHIVGCIFYLFNMFSLYDTFKSVIAISFVSQSGLLLFLAQTAKLYRSLMAPRKQNYTKLDSLAMGFGIALSSRTPPYSFRIIASEAAILIFSLILVLLNLRTKEASRRDTIKNYFGKLPVALASAAAGMLYWEIPLLLSLNTTFETFTYAYGAHMHFFEGGPYASITNTLRILGSWSFQTEYVPYHQLYFENPLVTTTSFLWPITCLALSVVLAPKKDRPKILILVLASLAIIGWDTANNPPAGAINTFIYSHMTFLPGLFPTYFLSQNLLTITYIMLATYTATIVLESKADSRRKAWKKLAATLLVVALLVPTMPLFTGEALGQYFNTNIKGIWVPQEYFQVKQILTSSHIGGSILLWPSLTFYVQTSWGYQGGSDFYNNFFWPANIITPQNPLFGILGYGLYNPDSASLYYSLTAPPMAPDLTRAHPIELDYENMRVFGAEYSLTGNNITLFNIVDNHVEVVIRFTHPVDASAYQFFLLELEPAKEVAEVIKQGELWVGISSPNTTGWYIIGEPAAKFYTSGNNVLIAMSVGYPSKPWPTSTYEPDNVTGMAIEIYIQGSTPTQALSFKIISLSLTRAMIDPYTLALWKQYGIKYLLVDRSIIADAANLTMYPVNLLLEAGIFKPIFIGNILELYQVSLRS